jgi:hypothetical protein
MTWTTAKVVLQRAVVAQRLAARWQLDLKNATVTSVIQN